MPAAKTISVIVPALNEEDNITALFDRIDRSLSDVTYEILLVDDHSTDSTVALAKSLSGRYPVRVLMKAGEPGKAQSLLEGFAAAQYDVLCMIDADLQYPPEAIGPMLTLLHDKNADVVVTEREENDTPLLRKITTKGFNLVFARLLFGISYDTQSGLKVFRKAVLNDFDMKPSPWSFDLEFLVRSLEYQRRILSYTIPFADRTGGVTKVKVAHVAYELAKASLALRWRTSKSKVRAGHRRNNSFIRKAFPASLFIFFALSGWLYSPKISAGALPSDRSLTGVTTQTLTAVTTPVYEILGSLPLLTDQGASPVANAPQATNISGTSSAIQNTATTTATVTSAVTTAVSTRQSTISTATPTTTRSSSDLVTLTAATGNGQTGVYQDTAYSPSSSTRRGISIVATALITAGAVCLVAAMSLAAGKAWKLHRRTV